MDACCAFIMKQLARAWKHCTDPIMLVEQRLDFHRWVQEGFGTGDACIMTDDVFDMIDLKYSVGILVDTTQNPQAILGKLTFKLPGKSTLIPESYYNPAPRCKCAVNQSEVCNEVQ